MATELELGQMAFGNPTGDYGTENWVDALIDTLINEISRIYWNNHQEEWDRFDDPEIRGVTYRPYYWGDGDEAELPNLVFDHTPEQEIRWYKHIGRGQSCTQDWKPQQWIDWFNKSLKVINDADKTFDP